MVLPFTVASADGSQYRCLYPSEGIVAEARRLAHGIAGVDSENPVRLVAAVGSEEQANDLIAYIREGEESKEGIWTTNIFGKSVGELMEDGIRSKILQMDDECQLKLQDTMQKIVNDSNGGMICIII